jgi:hypothetical protein
MGRQRDSRISIIDDRTRRAALRGAAEELGAACGESGFFYVVGHGVDAALQSRLRELSREFFAQDLQAKLAIRMALGGRAWGGYFRVGDELTSGKPDQKEGLYFGAELAAADPRVLAGTPLHGPNLFPAEPGPRGRCSVCGATGLGHRADGRLAACWRSRTSPITARSSRSPSSASSTTRRRQTRPSGAWASTPTTAC